MFEKQIVKYTNTFETRHQEKRRAHPGMPSPSYSGFGHSRVCSSLLLMSIGDPSKPLT